MKYAIITGASKGLGAAIGEHLLDHEYSLVDVSRTGSTLLKNKAAQKGLTYSHKKIDLSQLEETQAFIPSWFEETKDQPIEELLIIQNAGIVDPIQTVGNLDPHTIQKAAQTNYIAPVLITNAAFKHAEEKGIPATVVNITSGAADKPNHGWSIYGSTKAALNLFTETAALEQDKLKTKNKIISFSPSIMDTDMQNTIRSSTSDAFAAVSAFQAYKEQGKLRKPETVGKALVDLLMEKNLENGRLYHINELL
ncbi:SDR family NAD(P)-dependent oxidoreductase [Jeotgalibacillus proteolyticus]|uniref:Short-chain dehydrogenase n=1 Tax=Jeotgalibacillus proteolyticus TaxID=2082395 RepID=A0A2S5GC49_9BACL|nr:SDR family NAD(P)-dependent oxidoreductase [Jeotgalibacillus proteolyticus]PPA70590.1 short-chain dehydrogenase [Jeotgalibacillus proteolyticus]